MTQRRRRGAPPGTFFGVLLGGLLTLALAFAMAAPVSKPGPPSPFDIRWQTHPLQTNRAFVQVNGLSEAALRALQRSNWTSGQWQRVLAVHVEQGDWVANIGLPAMLGAYQVKSSGILFEPQFALTPGVTYRASFHPDQLPGGRETGQVVTAVFKLVPHRDGPDTVVSRIHPSADLLPENLLKFYLHFSAPMSGGHIYDHIHLRDDAGRPVELPFLEIDEELWNPAMTRLTLFIDPGRIKRGVRPLEEIGPALEEGKRYTLSIDRDWKDAEGFPLGASSNKTFRVGPPEREPLNPALWKIAAPAAGSRAALDVSFPAPMDHALAQRLIQVIRGSGEAVEGAVALQNQERQWSFTPALPWPAGPYQLVVPTVIEDLAGNNVGKSFEVDLFAPVQRRITNSVVKLDFVIR